MKKLLIGTTALVAGGLIAGSAMAAEVDVAPPEVIDDGFTVTWSGYIRSGFYIGDDECTEPNGINNCTLPGPNAAGSNPDANDTTVPLTAELQLFAEQTLANGLRVGGEIDFDIDNGTSSAVQIDEVWLFIDGNFGQLRLGQKEGALDSVGGSGKPGWGAFNGGTDGPDMGTGATGFFGGAGAGLGVTTNAAGALSAIGSDGSMEDISGDANKITYLSPEFAGINFAVSFTPDPQSQRANGRSLALNGDNERWLNEWSVGANATQTMGDYTLRVAGGFTSAEAEKNNTGLGDVDIYKFGGSIKSMYGGIGGWYSNREYDLITIAGVVTTPNLRVTETTSWGITGNIISGDYTFGGGYTNVEDEVYSMAGVNNTDNELDIWGLGVSKKLGTGVEMGVNATFTDYEGSYNSNAAVRGHSADGWLAGWYAAIAF